MGRASSGPRRTPPAPSDRRNTATMSKKLLALFVLVAALAAPSARALDWSDTSFRYWYGSNFKEPGVGTGKGLDVAKNILSFTHVDGWKYGGDFLHLHTHLSVGGGH